ncbi:DUF1835 domain-containing protein [Pedobacter sp. Hv1]|uniref:DUF1835 domain-containing protein n=1 Tax=Pedobacter sp. Hv1 TaxID=1740090 RepID=UPI0006D88A35|nr:DUF1835 domain-containing protein [Pedobacter sp. Hv1]KQC01483.1 hypothetical protein AQF98_07185 [Pedobacter sp. Hv1]
MKTLHILNGDATLAVFKQTSFDGDILVWREILAEGPVSHTDLWATRAKWICSTFNENEVNYQKNVLEEVKRLKNIEIYDELILWFEYDLVCQINLIYILSVLREVNAPNLSIQLICPDRFDGIPNFRGLGELNAVQLTQLYPNREKLTTNDLNLAGKAWDLYVANNPEDLQTFLQSDFGKLPLLEKALTAHLLRFPNPATQLNYIEDTLLAIIKSGITNRMAIHEAFWLKESLFGSTDLQINQLLDKLQANGFIKEGILH